MAITLSDNQVRHLRMRGQGLACPQAEGANAAVQVVRQAFALQAQDMFAATLGVRVRSTGATIAGVERARFAERNVVWTWAMRGTLHLLATDDLVWLLPLLGPVFVAAAHRRRQQLGLDEDTYARGVRAVRDYLAGHGPSTREELVGALAAAGMEGGYSIERHLLYRAGLEGILCMGPDRGPKPTFVLLEDWLGSSLAMHRDDRSTHAALVELVGRFLAAYAPATPADLAAWSGLSSSALRTGWAAVAGRLAEVTVAGQTAWLPAGRLAEIDEPPDGLSVRLLPAFDTYLLGYRSRDLIVNPDYAKRINAGGGMVRPVLLVNGRVLGIWKANRKGRRVNIAVDAFAELPSEVQAEITQEVADVGRFLATPAM